MNTRISKAYQLAEKVEEMDTLVNFLLADSDTGNELIGQQLLIAEKTGNLSYVNALIRMRVRAVVSMLEALCFYFWHLSRDLCVLLKKELSEECRKLDDNKKIDMKDKIKLSFRCLAYSLGNNIEIDVASGKWLSVCNLLERRHHITHPTNIEDLQVTAEDYENANMAMFWVIDFFYRFVGKENSKEYVDLQKQILNLNKMR